MAHQRAMVAYRVILRRGALQRNGGGVTFALQRRNKDLSPEKGVICRAIIFLFMSTSRPATHFSPADIERLKSTFIELIPYAGALRERVLSTTLELETALPTSCEEQEQALLLALAEAIDRATGILSNDTEALQTQRKKGHMLRYQDITAIKGPVIDTLRLCISPRLSKEDERLWESFFRQMSLEKERECGRKAAEPERA